MTTKKKQAPVKEPIKFIVEWTDTGFSAYSKEHPVITTGETLEEVRSNLVEAMNLLLEEEGVRVRPKDIGLFMDMRHFFKQYSILNAKELAARIDMNPTLLSQYVTGRKMPSEEQTKRIMAGIHQVGKELTAISISTKR